MVVKLDIPEDIEVRLLADAQARGVPLSEFVCDFIIEHYEQAEDRQVAESRLADRQAPISASQLRKNLGRDS